MKPKYMTIHLMEKDNLFALEEVVVNMHLTDAAVWEQYEEHIAQGGTDDDFEPQEVDVAALRIQYYAPLRKAAYGTGEKQMEMQVDGTWNNHIAAVKARFPKPE